MDCNRITRKISPYLDNEVSQDERFVIEAHLKECSRCAAEKRELEKLASMLHQVSDVVPAENAEKMFWKTVRETREGGLTEKLRSFIAEWDFVPLQYPATAVLLLGLIAGIVFNNAYSTGDSHQRMTPAALEYLALNRMDTIPGNSITGTYLSMQSTHHDIDGGRL
jgi:anti-sigma factor RsiW